MPDERVLGALTNMFTTFGKHHETERARLYWYNLSKDVSCIECAILACEQSVRERTTVPSYRHLLEAAEENQRSGAHTPHVLAPQLAPMAETFWRSDAVKLIAPKVEGDKDLASFIAASMWWNLVPKDSITDELNAYGRVWIEGARQFLDGKDTHTMVQRAYERARWASDHNWDLTGMPDRVRDLGVG